MPYITPSALDTIVVDFTSHCNSMCGNCSRNIGGVEVNPHMPLGHMDLKLGKTCLLRQ